MVESEPDQTFLEKRSFLGLAGNDAHWLTKRILTHLGCVHMCVVLARDYISLARGFGHDPQRRILKIIAKPSISLPCRLPAETASIMAPLRSA